ncbi:MAG: MBL fold metallo-hydrolase [bacterium]|nr:MBL fold metallo-hydrolase [bacterium]
MINTPENEVPYLETIAGFYHLLPRSNTLPPIGITNCFVIGDPGKPTFIVDPSPVDEEEYGKLVNTLNRISDENQFKYAGIFITHHHWDHHLDAPRMAREFSLPILISRDSHHRIVSKFGEEYFEGLEVKHVGDGDVLNQWKGQDVKVYEVPGHDEGQLAFAPEGMDWFMAGDLFQGVGTVVIGGEEGDMIKYFQSLERIIQLDPKYVIPSHGGPQPTTRIIKKTLKHRKHREKQVLKFHKKGRTPQQMIEIIYADVDRRLWPLALENIKAHLEKLRREQVI